MKTRTRFIPETIAALLLVSVIVTTLLGGDETGRFGPVDAIILAGSDGDLTLNTTDNHLSWGEEKTSKAWSIGFMEIGKALSQLMKAEHFEYERKELNAQLEEQLLEARDVLDLIIEEGKKLEQDDPKAAEIMARGQQAYAEFQNLQQLGAEARSKLVSEQMELAYQEVVEAVNVVAERMHVDIVLRFIPPDNDFQQGNPDGTIMQIRMRTALRLPEGVDITDDVLTELGLDLQ